MNNCYAKFIRLLKSVYAYLFIEKRYGFGCCKSVVDKPLRICGASNIYIYANCSIMPLARLEAVQVYAGKHYDGKLIIKEGVNIGQGAHIIACSELVIENNATLSSYVFISDCHHSYDDIETRIMRQPLVVKQVHIGEGCLIGRGVAILAGASVGKHSVIGANSVVTGKVPDYSVACGIPAKVIKKYDFEKKEWVKIKDNEV